MPAPEMRSGCSPAPLTEARQPRSTVLHGTELANWGLSNRAAISGLIGGIAARIVSGNFAEGFSIAAAAYLYNDAAHQKTTPDRANEIEADVSARG
jgi:hypothetical protein